MMKLWSFILILWTASTSTATVWNATQVWTEEKENQFAEFIEKEFSTDFFTNPLSVGYGIPTDCADALYIARAIFAWKNSLPIQFTHPNGGAIRNSMTQWDHQPPEQRLRSFLNFIGEVANTTTMINDTYPVKIDPKYFKAGVIYLSPPLTDYEKARTKQSGGHAEIVKSVDPTGYIRTMGSTTPKLVRNLTSHRNPVHAPVVDRGGFRRFKQPQHFSMNTMSIEGFGLDQFTMGEWQPLYLLSRKKIYLWNEAIRAKLRTQAPTFEDRVDVVVESICDIYKSRVEIVKAAWSKVQSRGNRCLRGSEYDDYSTPKKDARIKEAYKQLDDMYKWRKLDGGNHNIKDAKELLQKCVVEYWPGYTADTWELFLRMIDGRIVSDPNFSPAVRWGWKEKPLNPTCSQ